MIFSTLKTRKAQKYEIYIYIYYARFLPLFLCSPVKMENLNVSFFCLNHDFHDLPDYLIKKMGNKTDVPRLSSIDCEDVRVAS